MVKNDKVTIRDIAKILGISPSTVSRAMSGKPGVNENLRNKILTLAEELGYIPNIVANGFNPQRIINNPVKITEKMVWELLRAIL